MTKRILLTALIIIPAITAFAGTDYPMQCSNCGFESHVQVGGGKLFEQLTGFCPETGKFVYLTWKRGAKKPEPFAKLWDSASGKMIEIYKCPDCPQPFLPLRLKSAGRDDPGFDCCPKCGKHTFKVEKARIMMFD
jgi:hypothetical protein